MALGHKGIWGITQNALHALFSTAPPPPPPPPFPPTALVEGRQHPSLSYCTAWFQGLCLFNLTCLVMCFLFFSLKRKKNSGEPRKQGANKKSGEVLCCFNFEQNNQNTTTKHFLLLSLTIFIRYLSKIYPMLPPTLYMYLCCVWLIFNLRVKEKINGLFIVESEISLSS